MLLWFGVIWKWGMKKEYQGSICVYWLESQISLQLYKNKKIPSLDCSKSRGCCGREHVSAMLNSDNMTCPEFSGTPSQLMWSRQQAVLINQFLMSICAITARLAVGFLFIFSFFPQELFQLINCPWHATFRSGLWCLRWLWAKCLKKGLQRSFSLI